MRKPLALLCLAAAVLLGQGFQSIKPESAAAPAAAPSPEDRWRRGVDAWDAGNYPAALSDPIALMKSKQAGDYVERVGELTGEKFNTIEITADGRNPKFAANGQLVSFETGPASATVTRIVRLERDAASTVGDLPGVSAAFDAAGSRVAYLRPAQDAQWVDA